MTRKTAFRVSAFTFALPAALIVVGLILMFLGTSTEDSDIVLSGWLLISIGIVVQFLSILRRRS